MTVRDQTSIEVWKNVGAGMCWVTVFNPLGAEVSKNVRGGQTFTLSITERRVNQYSAANSELDLFRNGRFLLLKPSDDTVMDEIESPQSLTDDEIIDIVHQVIHTPEIIDRVLARITSPTTINRLMEEMVVGADLPGSVIDKVKAAMKTADGKDDVVDREAITMPDPPRESPGPAAGPVTSPAPQVTTPNPPAPTPDTPAAPTGEPLKA